jgi:hypothetical protein
MKVLQMMKLRLVMVLVLATLAIAVLTPVHAAEAGRPSNSSNTISLNDGSVTSNVSWNSGPAK